jgi:tetratricopeptide (TPR) repeat protein
VRPEGTGTDLVRYPRPPSIRLYRYSRNVNKTWLPILAIAATLAGCTVPQPYEPPRPAPQPAPTPGGTPVETQPVPPPPPVEEPVPLPPPVVREPTLGAASRALVTQAQQQAAAQNYAMAAATIERALRIEPDNPLLWIELGKVRQAEGNYQQAENMGRKAASMAVNAPKTQAAAWDLVAEALRARGKNAEAQEAQSRADQMRR